MRLLKYLLIIILAYMTFPLFLGTVSTIFGGNPLLGLVSFIAVTMIAGFYESHYLPEDVTLVDKLKMILKKYVTG